MCQGLRVLFVTHLNATCSYMFLQRMAPAALASPCSGGSPEHSCGLAITSKLGFTKQSHAISKNHKNSRNFHQTSSQLEYSVVVTQYPQKCPNVIQCIPMSYQNDKQERKGSRRHVQHPSPNGQPVNAAELSSSRLLSKAPAPAQLQNPSKFSRTKWHEIKTSCMNMHDACIWLYMHVWVMFRYINPSLPVECAPRITVNYLDITLNYSEWPRIS